THRLDQRPVAVLLAVLAPPVRSQKHSCMILSWNPWAFKRVGLHYIAGPESTSIRSIAYRDAGPENRGNQWFSDELGLTAILFT
ncbi:MAG TPA: hypothetical protein VIY49_26655, partial [Bryobacteraceae bacterium]